MSGPAFSQPPRLLITSTKLYRQVEVRGPALDLARALAAKIGIQLQPASTRRFLHPTVTEAELKKLNDGGVRGIRFTLGDPATAVVTIDMVEPLAKRIADLGWTFSSM